MRMYGKKHTESLFNDKKMLYTYTRKRSKRKSKDHTREYDQVMKKRVAFVNEKIQREKEEKAKLQYF